LLNLHKIWIPTVLAAVLALAGCSDSDFREDLPAKDEDLAGEVYIRFQMNLNSAGAPGMSRAETATSGTDMEDAVNTVDLFVYDAVTDVMSDYVYLGKEQIEQLTSEDGIVVPIYAEPEKDVHIYVAVNLTEKMRSLFAVGQTGNAASILSAYTDYWDVIDEFVPGTAGHQTKLESDKAAGIPMTGQFKIVGSSSYDIKIPQKPTTKNNPLKVVADASRIVAKIHVLAITTGKLTLTDGSEVEYVTAEDKTSHAKETDDSKYANWIGWIRLSDVRYMPNGMNKSSYIFPQDTEAGKLKDLNMNLSSYLIDNRFDEMIYNNDYVFYKGVSLHSANISASEHTAKAEAFNQERFDYTTSDPSYSDRYTQGMYCLENYFDTPSDNDAFFKTYDDAIPMVTHLSIAARLTPRNIVVAQDYADKMDRFVRDFEQSPDAVRKRYGLSPEDFTKEEDVAQWNTLKEKYFSSTTIPGTYRDDFRIVKAGNEKDAAYLIKWSLMANNLWSGDDSDFENGKYPASTFYVYDTKYDDEGVSATDTWTQRYLYLTAGAVTSATDENIRIKTYSVPHVGGWGYYYTYLDNNHTTVNGVTPFTASQVTRNTYYIVTVENFGVPGGTITRPEYIKVNTVPVGWDYRGKGDIILH